MDALTENKSTIGKGLPFETMGRKRHCPHTGCEHYRGKGIACDYTGAHCEILRPGRGLPGYSGRFDMNVFMDKLAMLKDEFCIHPSHARSGETVSKRIAILVNDAYLESNGDDHWASVLERKIYEEAKRENFTCDPIGYELSWEENRHKSKDKKWNPLKLAFDHLDRYDGFHPMIVHLSNKIFELLSMEGQKDEEARECTFYGLDQRETLSAELESKQINGIKLDERKGPSLCAVRE